MPPLLARNRTPVIRGPSLSPLALTTAPEVLDSIERLAASEVRYVNAELEVLAREALARRGIRIANPSKDDAASGERGRFAESRIGTSPQRVRFGNRE